MSVFPRPSDEVVPFDQPDELRDDSWPVALFYWSAVFTSAAITVFGFWKLYEFVRWHLTG